MTEHARITLAPEVLAGKPVISGTRLSVEFVIGLMADGWSEAEILENYGVTHDDILACLAYARDMLNSECSPAQPDMRFLANENFPRADGEAGRIRYGPPPPRLEGVARPSPHPPRPGFPHPIRPAPPALLPLAGEGGRLP